MIKVLISKLNRNQDGSILPIFAGMVLVLVVIGGAAIDISRSVNAREKLAYAIDAAALSVATDLSTSALSDVQIKQRIENSFRANLADAEFLDQAIENLSFVIDDDEGTVTVTSFAGLNNYFVNIGGLGKDLLGPDAFNFGTNARVNYSRFDVELALIVDVTGSMRGDMPALREASTDVVNILLPEDQDQSEAKVRISLVPYSTGVNLGVYADVVKGGAYGFADSSDCVTERQDYDDGTELYDVKYTDSAYNYYTKSNPPPKATFYGDGSNDGCSSDSVMIPLTDDRDELIDAIEDLEADGGTAGHTGAIWGWNVLSPNYANLWPAASVPAAYNDDNILKFAIMMTDGDNNRAFDLPLTEYKKVGEENCRWVWRNGGWRWRCYDIYDWVDIPESELEWEVNSDTGKGYSNEASVRHRAYCTAMKDAGIEVFGVYFGSNNSSTGARNMQNCASSGNYYQASSYEGLKQAFSNIAKKIQSIYLSR